jgi:internalin A
MVSNKSKSVLSTALLAISIAILSGCGSGSGSGGVERKSAVSLELKWPNGYSFNSKTSQLNFPSSPSMMAAPSYVTGCRVTVSGVDITPITLDVPLSTGEVGGSVTPGERRFDVLVSTNVGITFTGFTTVTLVPGPNGAISIQLVVNAPPTAKLSVSNASPKIREAVAVSVAVTDPDVNDVHTITWNAGGGVIGGSGASVTWMADLPGNYTVSVTVDDGKGGVVTEKAGINIGNNIPVMQYVKSDKTQVAPGDIVNLSCSATDADGDKLSYSWSDGLGWSATGPNVAYTVKNAAVKSITLTCAVADGHPGGTASGTVTLVIGGLSLTGLFPDANLAACVAAAFPTATITSQVVGKLDCSSKNISNLTGIGNLTGVNFLALSGNQIANLAPLAGLTTPYLDLAFNKISSLTGIETLKGLITLNLFGNMVADVTPLASLTAAQVLDLGSNQILDVTPLTTLPALTMLAVDGNKITDAQVVQLSTITKLTWLHLRSNLVTNIAPLANLVNLTDLWLGANFLTDVTPLQGLTGLVQLELYGNRITNVWPLTGLTALTYLTLGNNQIVNVAPLASLTKLTYLDAPFNLITTGVKSLTTLTSAHIYLTGNIAIPCLDLNILICGVGHTVANGVCSPNGIGGLGVNVEISGNGLGNIDTPTSGVNCGGAPPPPPATCFCHAAPMNVTAVGCLAPAVPVCADWQSATEFIPPNIPGEGTWPGPWASGHMVHPWWETTAPNCQYKITCP